MLQIYLPIITSCTENLSLALDQSFKNEKSSVTEPVLFVIGLQNYEGFTGLKLNIHALTAYINEQEVILRDGFQFHVLGIQKIDNIRNSSGKWGANSSIKVIHLFH